MFRWRGIGRYRALGGPIPSQNTASAQRPYITIRAFLPLARNERLRESSIA